MKCVSKKQYECIKLTKENLKEFLRIVEPYLDKKKRINKKMLKKHGHPNYVHRFETVKGWKLRSYTNGEFEFVKDGDKL